MTGFISFIIVFSVVIFVHELGHFVTAKLFHVPVLEFGFGYPPRLVKLGQWRETEITLNWLPLGGFVRMSEDEPDVPGSLATRSPCVRAICLSAGALMNLLLAIVLYAATFVVGTPVPVDGLGAGIYQVGVGSPAEQAGFEVGDTIVSIDGITVEDSSQAAEMIAKRAGTEMVVVLRRDGQPLAPIQVTPRLDPPPDEGALGVVINQPLAVESFPVWQAVPMGARAAWRTVAGMGLSMVEAIRGNIPFQISGPIGIYQTTVQVAKSGVLRLIEFTAFLSVNLFLVNLLPLPALDGGRLIFVFLEWIRGGKRIAPEKEGAVHAVGMLALILLMVIVTVFDYRRYFG